MKLGLNRKRRSLWLRAVSLMVGIALMLTLTAFQPPARTAYAAGTAPDSGNGTPDTPYIIDEPLELVESALSTLSINGAAPASAVTHKADHSTSSYGMMLNLWVGYDDGIIESAALRFNLSGYAGRVTAATLNIYVSADYSSGTEGVFDLYGSDDDGWTDALPSFWDASPLYANVTGPMDVWQMFDVSEYVADHLNNKDRVVTFYLAGKPSSGTNDIRIDSHEAPEDHRPYLLLVFDETPPTVTLSSSDADRLVRSGDVVSITAAFDEEMADTPTITISNTPVSDAAMSNDSGDRMTWTYTWTVPAGDMTATATVAGTDLSGNAYAGGDSLVFTVDNTAPQLTAVSIASNNTTASLAKPGATVTLSFAADEPIATPVVTIAGHPASIGDAGDADDRTCTASYVMTSSDSEGAIPFTVDFTDLAGNVGTRVTATIDGSSVTFDKTAPTISISAPSSSIVKDADVTYTITYSGADTVTLVDSDVTLNKTGTANGTVSVSDLGDGVWLATITGITGDGTLGISIAAGTAADNAGNTAAATGPSDTFTVDNTAPTVSISGPSVGLTKDGPVTYTVTYSGADTITLTEDDVTLSATGTASAGDVEVSGAGSTRTVTISGITGDGTLSVSIKPGTATDAAGNAAAAAGPNGTLTVDNTAPSLDSASIASNNATASLAKPGDQVSVAFSVLGGPVATPVATIAGHAATVGDGGDADPDTWVATYTMTGSDTEGPVTFTVQFSDLAGNAAGPFSATTDGSSVTFDKTVPQATSVTIGSSNADTSRAKTGDTITLNLTTSEPVQSPAVTIAGHAASVGDGGDADPATWVATYTMAGTDTEGPVTFTVQFSDLAGNAGLPVTATTDSSSVVFDKTAPQMSVTMSSSNAGDPSRAKVGDVVTLYMDADEAIETPAVTIAGHVASVDDAGDADPSTWTATYTLASGDPEGAVTFQVNFIDLVGNSGVTVTGVTSGSAVILDKMPPSITISAPSLTSTNAGPVTYTVTYVDASDVTLSAGDVTLNRTGTADGTVDDVSPVPGFSDRWTVTISGITGEGTLGISIAAGTATDVVGNLADVAGPSQAFEVDNTAPAVSISAPSRTVTSNTSVTYTISYSGVDVITLAASDVTLNQTGTADGVVSVSGAGANERTVTISGITGDGTLSISIAPGTASDDAGNVAPATGPSAAFRVDNTPPTLAGASRTDNTHLIVELDEDCTNLTSSDDGGFTVHETGNPARTYAVSSTDQGADAKHVVLTVADMSSSVLKGVTVTYSAGGNGTIQDLAGNPLASDPAGVSVVALPSPDSEARPDPLASGATTQEGGRTVTTVTLDEKAVQRRLDAGTKTIAIPVDTGADIVSGILTGQLVKNMEQKDAVLEIRTGNVIYTLPASEFDIDSVSEQLGSDVDLSDIVVNIKISEPSADTVEIVEDAANKGSYQIVVLPVEFEITCTYGSKTVEVTRFSGYVERTIAIPDGVDPSKITTAVVLNSDGTLSHVPTTIVVINGKYYAKINSLSNSVYSLIWNPVEFADMVGHWAEGAVNDMGSRLVVNGVGDGLFDPDRDVTRAEFATIMVRGLGLQPGLGETPFADVAETAWYCGYIQTAHEYGLIGGYGDGRFGPNDKITREQAFVIVARAMALTGLGGEVDAGEAERLLAGFADSGAIADYAGEGIAACVKTGIASGRTATELAPKGNITRAETAVIVRRLLQLSGLI